MKALAVLRASLRQSRRDLLTVALSLAFAPLFVLLYAAVFGAGTTYQVGVLNADRPVTAGGTHAPLDAGSELVAALTRTGSASTAADATSTCSSGSPPTCPSA